jgi:hypothetical protein
MVLIGFPVTGLFEFRSRKRIPSLVAYVYWQRKKSAWHTCMLSLARGICLLAMFEPAEAFGIWHTETLGLHV